MSIWSKISDAISALTSGESLKDVFEKLRTPPERTTAFAIGVIALGAKMAKADGQVTRDEVSAFRRIFHIPQSEETNAARVFNLARQDVAGFEDYARRIARMFGDDRAALCDLMEGLFEISVADGEYHPNEDIFLARIGEIFGLTEQQFRILRLRFVPDAAPDPHDVLGVSVDATMDEKKAAWRALVRQMHPDQMIARGVPEEAVKLAEKRLIAINDAWQDIQDAA